MTLRLLALAAVAGCASPPATPPAPPPDASLALADTAAGPVSRLVPIVGLRDGRSDTLDVAELVGTGAVSFLGRPHVAVDAVGGGRVVVRVAPDAVPPVLVPFEVEGVRYVIATQREGAQGLDLRLEGPDPADPSLLVFVARSADGSPLMLDDEDGVALVDNRVLEENALDVHADRLVLDLDAVGPGRRRIRVAAAPPGDASNWAEVAVEDGRLADGLPR
ncbi:hypothetical protein [Rubrivirga sp.]|uniref:hypothetical protein n=1 Tax=Rubrivirga sp. TaxID=1885344 RepID=UPI003B526BEB